MRYRFESDADSLIFFVKGIAMSIYELDQILYDTYQMDIWMPSPMSKRKDDFKMASYSFWAIEELKRYIRNQLYPKTEGTMSEFICLTEMFRDKTLYFSSLNYVNRKMFTIAERMIETTLDLLHAME